MKISNWKHTLRQGWQAFSRFVERWLPADQPESQPPPARVVEPIESPGWQRAMEQWREELRDTLEHLLPARWVPGEQPAQDGVLAPLSRIGPAIEVEETETDVIVRADMPGLAENDFKVEVTGRRLVIRGEKTATTEEHKSGYYRSERRYGAFTRAVSLPCEIESDRVQATYKSGVLQVTLPKTEQAKSTRIAVEIR